MSSTRTADKGNTMNATTERVLAAVTALPGRTVGFYADHLEIRQDAALAALRQLRNTGAVRTGYGPVAGVELYRVA